MRTFAAAPLLLAALACARKAEEAPRDDGPRGDTAAVSARPEAAPTSDGRPAILFIGTSLTAGLGLDPSQAYPAMIQRRVDSARLSYQVVNAGVSGETSSNLVDRIDWVLRRPAAVIVIETGANDGLRGLPVAQLRANLQTVLDRVRAAQPRARVFLVQMEAPPNLGPRYTSEFRGVFPELAAKNRVGLVPFLLEGVAGNATLNQGDGIHPNLAGERIVAETVWKAIAPALSGGSD